MVYGAWMVYSQRSDSMFISLGLSAKRTQTMLHEIITKLQSHAGSTDFAISVMTLWKQLQYIKKKSLIKTSVGWKRCLTHVLTCSSELEDTYFLLKYFASRDKSISHKHDCLEAGSPRN